MAVHADRTRDRKRGAPRPGERVPVRGRRRVAQSVGLATVALLTAVATPAAAQQTVIIGGPAIIGSGAGGLIVNNEVLESLGSSPEVPALPYQAPGSGFRAAPVMPVTPGVMPGLDLGPGVSTLPGIVYRQPDTGQLLVTRPGRLLFPPPRAPRSRLATEMPEAPTARPEPKLTSRLLVPPPPQSARAPEPVPAMPPAPVEPVVETPVVVAEPPTPPAPPAPPAPAEPKAVTPAPEPAPPPAPPPAPKAPEPQVAAQPEPSEAAEAPPPPSTLAEELTQKPAPAEPGQEPAAVAKAEPAAAPEPVVQPAAPPPAPPPAAAAPPPAESEPPPPPAESLTSGPAVEPQTAALPPAAALAEQIRVLFRDGSAELSDDAKRRLSAVATALQENTPVRIQLLAYAKASSEGTSRARRLSLSRALAVRAYLIEKGVRSTRMDVRALGDKIGGGPADRVDIRPQAAN